MVIVWVGVDCYCNYIVCDVVFVVDNVGIVVRVDDCFDCIGFVVGYW